MAEILRDLVDKHLLESPSGDRRERRDPRDRAPPLRPARCQPGARSRARRVIREVSTFVDTSALYALLDVDDENHAAAATWLRGPGATPTNALVTHSYVIVETAALVQHRLGVAAVRDLFNAFVPALTVTFVDAALHAHATAAYLAGLRRRVSFVDRVSFELMRDAAFESAFAFDRDFTTEGFKVVP